MSRYHEILAELGVADFASITPEWVASFAGQLNDPAKQAAWSRLLDLVAEFNPESYKKLNSYASQNKGMLLEFQGYEEWLKTLGPHTFTHDLSDFQRDIWDWYWPTTLKQRGNKPLDLEDITYLAIWGRGLGKCLAEGTQILYGDGQRHPIEDVKPGDILMAVDCATGRSVKDRVENTFRSGKQKCLRVRTRTNKSILATSAHRFWTIDGWRSVSELKAGDRIALPRRTRTVFWDEIKEISDGGEHETYDLTMRSPSHNFIANEIVSHNSSNAEWLAIAEGCLVGKGFVLYVSSTAEQAESHVEAIRDRLETEGHLSQLYPGMRKPSGKGGFVGEHRQYGWRQDYLMTSNGWAIRPVGLDKAIRGWKRGDARVTMICFDDIDDDDDSPEVIAKKERRISKKILPMGTARTKVVFAQNLIHSNSVLNRIHTRQTDILALRRGDVVVKAFDELEIEYTHTLKGPRWLITKGLPTWPHIDMAECQSFLDRSGRDAFLAEYQHDFSGEQNDRVLPEYDDRILRIHVITWSQYEAKYGHRRIPPEWPCDVGLDIGYTTGHKSAWTWLTKVPEWADLPGTILRYRGRVFTGIGIDEQAVAVRRDMWPDERIDREFMSHEKLGERMVLNTKHGWHFQPCESAKTAGIPQWRHHLITDRTKPHPFHRDEKMPDGLWKLGRPAWFDIVDDDQLIAPRDDRGLKTHRDQAYHWKMRKVEETKSGMTIEQPMKANEDSCDSTRSLTSGTAFGPADGRSSVARQIATLIPDGYHRTELLQRNDLDSFQRQFNAEVAEFLAKRTFKARKTILETDPWGQQIR